eukprot:TRINITY_DN11856_c0_g1_i1.p1 TRINITY_DN11856_c0_g1~~TRINITY_DN11856_c0_g1_i1.p1  ORF type:complete len:290 (-),score=82.90 TRINITY_DN11856_c0_g1_i1:45-857(-)
MCIRDRKEEVQQVVVLRDTIKVLTYETEEKDKKIQGLLQELDLVQAKFVESDNEAKQNQGQNKDLKQPPSKTEGLEILTLTKKEEMSPFERTTADQKEKALLFENRRLTDEIANLKKELTDTLASLQRSYTEENKQREQIAALKREVSDLEERLIKTEVHFTTATEMGDRQAYIEAIEALRLGKKRFNEKVTQLNIDRAIAEVNDAGRKIASLQERFRELKNPSERQVRIPVGDVPLFEVTFKESCDRLASNSGKLQILASYLIEYRTKD